MSPLGKDTLAPLLREAGWPVSTSMVGRILTQLMKRGVLLEPLATHVAGRCARHRHPEFRLRPLRPHPLFREFVGAAVAYAAGQRAAEEEPATPAPSDVSNVVAAGGS